MAHASHLPAGHAEVSEAVGSIPLPAAINRGHVAGCPPAGGIPREVLHMSDLYFLELLMGERQREVARPAEARTRLGLRRLPTGPRLGRPRRWLGAWLIRIGHRLQRGAPEPCGITPSFPGRGSGARQCDIS